jgi:hypothetical protein
MECVFHHLVVKNWCPIVAEGRADARLCPELQLRNPKAVTINRKVRQMGRIIAFVILAPRMWLERPMQPRPLRQGGIPCLCLRPRQRRQKGFNYEIRGVARHEQALNQRYCGLCGSARRRSGSAAGAESQPSESASGSSRHRQNWTKQTHDDNGAPHRHDAQQNEG